MKLFKRSSIANGLLFSWFSTLGYANSLISGEKERPVSIASEFPEAARVLKTNAPSGGPVEVLTVEALYDFLSTGVPHVVQVTGFSGAESMSLEEDAFKNYLRRIVSRAPDGTLFVLGGTTDGIGKFYDILNQFRPRPFRILSIGSKNILKHPSSLGKADLLTVVAPPEKDSYELTTVDGLSLTASIALHCVRRGISVDQYILEGGAQTLRENIELLKRLDLEPPMLGKLSLNFGLSWRTEKPEKDKGVRAAAQILDYLNRHGDRRKRLLQRATLWAAIPFPNEEGIETISWGDASPFQARLIEAGIERVRRGVRLSATKRQFSVEGLLVNASLTDGKVYLDYNSNDYRYHFPIPLQIQVGGRWTVLPFRPEGGEKFMIAGVGDETTIEWRESVGLVFGGGARKIGLEFSSQKYGKQMDSTDAIWDQVPPDCAHSLGATL